MGSNGKGAKISKQVWYDGYDSSTKVNDSVGEIEFRENPKPDKPKKVKVIKAEPKRKIAICGTADSLAAAPFADKDWTVYICAPCLTYTTTKRWDLVFEVHDENYVTDKVIAERLNKADCTVMMQKHYEQIPKSEPYPLEKVAEGYHKNFTNTIAFMIAYAVYEHKLHGDVAEIGVWGVNMAANEEYNFQRPSCEYWLGIAEANGIKVVVHGDNSAVLKCHTIYGYDREWMFMREARTRKKQLEIGEKELNQKVEEMKQHFWQQQGALKDVDWFLRKYE